MSNLKFGPGLFLEVTELERFKRFLDTDGFRKNILENSVKFGLIKNQANTAFTNGRVERDIDTSLGSKTLKIRELFAINSDGQFLYSPEINNIPIPSDTNWYWLRIHYVATPQEIGSVSLAINGDLVGSGTQFLTTLRGGTSFPSRISFTNSVYNTLEYDVLEVIDDTHAIIVHPATNSSGVAEYAVENNLNYKVVGTFTGGTAIDQDDKYIFEYDSCTYELVLETSQNVRPTNVIGQEFFLARVKVDGTTLIVQDKRLDYWETKGSELSINIDRNSNPLIGVEAVKWKHPFSPSDLNIVEVSWGMRSQNWAVDSSQNILTLFGSSIGGKFKVVEDFTNGDFDGWRLYYSNGKYSNVISSVKQGAAINLTLDVLDVDNVSNDGGVTFNNVGATANYVLVTPNCEEVILQFKSDPGDLTLNVNRTFTFPVNTLVAKCELQAYKETSCFYNMQYAYKSFKEYTEFTPLPSDTVIGYYTEASFDSLGNLKTEVDRVRFPYTADPTVGFIALIIAPFSYHYFTKKVDKGDIIGVNTITDLSSTQVIELIVGTSKSYQYVTGTIAITDDVYFSLSDTGAQEGNEFRIHFDAASVGLGGKNIYIVRNYTGGTPDILIKINQGDIYEMLNHDGGICFDCVYTGSNWVVYTNYNQGEHFTIGMTDGIITDLFDGGGWGKVKGFFGRHLADGNDGVVDLRDKFIVGAGFSYVKGATGGTPIVTLTVDQMPAHTHKFGKRGDRLLDVATTQTIVETNLDQTAPAGGYEGQMLPAGGGQPFDNRPPYYALFYFKKMY